jgi:clan AA aspartic protease (TIGR02281 family)
MRTLALTVFATVLLVAPARADEIRLEKQGGTYTVPVTINGTIKIKFMLDSGASDVLIPADTALTLVRSGALVESDFIGDQMYSLADGSTLQSAKFMLRQMQVGNQILRDVVASIGPVTSTPLLGQSFLSRIGSWTLDNNRHILVFNPPPGQVPPQATIPKERKWADLSEVEVTAFRQQCYDVVKAAALQLHKGFCLVEWTLLSGQ